MPNCQWLMPSIMIIPMNYRRKKERGGGVVGDYNWYKTRRWYSIRTSCNVSTCYHNEYDWERETLDWEANFAAVSSSCIVNSLVEGQNFVFAGVSMASKSVDLKEKWVLVASMVLSINTDLDR